MPELSTGGLETTIDPENDYAFVVDTSETPDAINRILMKYLRQVEVPIVVGDETTDLTTGTGKAWTRIPFAMTVTGVRASVNTAPAGSTIIVDINEGETPTTILSTKLTIDAGEKTSTTAATPAVISDTALADDAAVSVDIDQIGSGTAGKGLRVWIIGYRS